MDMHPPSTHPIFSSTRTDEDMAEIRKEDEQRTTPTASRKDVIPALVFSPPTPPPLQEQITPPLAIDLLTTHDESDECEHIDHSSSALFSSSKQLDNMTNNSHVEIHNERYEPSKTLKTLA